MKMKKTEFLNTEIILILSRRENLEKCDKWTKKFYSKCGKQTAYFFTKKLKTKKKGICNVEQTNKNLPVKDPNFTLIN